MDIFLSSAYLSPIQYIARFQNNNRIFIDLYGNYIKQSYRNRCLIMAANGAMPLSVPIEHASGEKVLMKDVRISRHGNWQHLHWNAIVSAYNSSPFFEYFADDFAPFYSKRYDFLMDLNNDLLNLILSLLGLDNYILVHTNEYKSIFVDNEQDLRESIHPKKDWLRIDPEFNVVPYYQVFGQKFGFTGNMSIIDLLFNMGNESILILRDSYSPSLLT